MAVLRPDQAQLTFFAETSPGADSDQMNPVGVDEATTLAVTGSGGLDIYPAGTTKIRVTDVGAIKVGDFIVIGRTGTISAPIDLATRSIWHREIRRVEHIVPDSSGDLGWLHLDRPLSYPHYLTDAPSSGTALLNAVGRVISSVTTANETKHIRFVPGVYDTVDTPDPVMAIEPRYFLGTASKRNFSSVYTGQHTYQGALNGIVLLNGWPLRWGIGREIPIPRTTSTFSFDQLGANSNVGDTYIKFNGAVQGATTNLAVGDYIVIGYAADGSGNAAGYQASAAATQIVEINQVKRVNAAVASNQWVELEHPLKYAHISDLSSQAVGTQIRKVTPSGGITHYIVEDNDLSSISMHLAMKDSAETIGFHRRWLGGKVGAMSIIAEEGGLLTVNWDSLMFKDMIHNQSKSLGANRYSATEAVTEGGGINEGSAIGNIPDMPGYALMNTYNTADIVLPTTEPYYFSGGTIKFKGTEFARVRSFAIAINNNEDPRYYISSRYGSHKGPSEIREQRREYSITCTVALPDTQALGYSTNLDSATSLFNELLLEGRYTEAGGHEGFDIELKFVRGTFTDPGGTTWEDAMWIHVPGIDMSSTNELQGSDGDSGTLYVPGSNISQAVSGAVNRGGAFIRTAPHTITTEAPFQVALDMIARNMTIVVRDQEPYYP